MRRPPIACPRAVQSLNPAPSHHIWISDDVLSRALLGFFRVNCPHQKRHGSHVPGPLEARRRAAKRRMTAQANFCPQPAFSPPLFDLAALFGSRQRKETWRYEPPSIRHVPSDSSLHLLPSMHPPATTSSLPTKPKEQSSPVQREKAMDDVKHHMGIADAMPAHTRYEYITDSCQAPMMDMTGKSTIRLLRYLPDTPSGRHLAVRFLSKPQVHLPDIYTSLGLEMLQILEGLSTKLDDLTRAQDVYMKYASLSSHVPPSNGSKQDAHLRLLIQGLWHTAGSVVDAVPSLLDISMKLSNDYHRQTLTRIFERPDNSVFEIAKLVNTSPDLDTLVDILTYVPRTVLRTWAWELQDKALLSKKQYSFWLRLFYRLDCKLEQLSGDYSFADVAFKGLVPSFLESQGFATPRRLLVEALLYKLMRHDSFTAVDPQRSYEFATNYVSELTQQEKDKSSLHEMLIGLVNRLDDASLPNHGVLEILIPTIKAERGDQWALGLLLRVVERTDRFSNTSFLTSYVGQTVHQLKATPDHAIRTAKDRHRHAFALWTCWQLDAAIKAIDKQTGASDDITSLQARRKFAHIIDRAKEARVVPMAYRKFDGDVPMAQRRALIYQLAHQYSLDQTRTYRQNWRSIYYLYGFLKQYELPLSPLFVQAVVRVCLVQPMSQREFVSARRLRFVCRLVERVEGVEAARKIEHVFWVWRGDLIKHAKDKMVSVGHFGRAHLRTLKKMGIV